MKVIAAADMAPVPWKNGGGVTRELLRVEGGEAGDWHLRISVADIDADGPFSPFPGVTRWFAVLEGAGVRLAWPGRVMDVRPGDDAIQFDGAQAPGCTLIAGSTRDLNVMLRGDAGSAGVTRAAFGEPRQAADVSGLFSLRPLRLQGPAGETVEMPALALAWMTPGLDATGPWRIEPLDDATRAEDHTRSLPAYWISFQASDAP